MQFTTSPVSSGTQNQFWTSENAKDVLIILGCGALNLLLTLILYPKFAYIGTDGVSYALMAKSLAEGAGLTVFHQPHIFFSPGLSFVIAPFYLLIEDIDLAAHVAVIVLGLLTLPFFYFGMRSFVGRHIAAIGTLFLAVNATVVWKNLRPLAQPLATFLSVLLFFFLAKYTAFDKQRPKVFAYSFLLGLISGALYLTRPEYIVVIFPVVVFLFLVNRKTVAWKRNIAIILPSLIGFLLLAMPYITFLHTHTGQWTFTGRLYQQIERAQGLSLYAESTPSANNSAGLFLKSIFAPKFLKVYLSNLYDIEWYLLRIFGIIGFAFFGIGLWKVVAEKRFVILEVLAVPTAMLLAFGMGFNGDFGYLEPYVFIFIFLISIGCDEFVSALRGVLASVSWARAVTAVGVVALATVYFAFPLFQSMLFRPADTAKPVEYQLLGQYFHESVVHPEEERIVARKPEFAFYSGADWVEISNDDSPEQILGIMKEKHAGYLAIDTRSMGEAAQRFFDAQNKSPTKAFEFVREFTYGGERVNLYRFRE